MGNKYRVSNKNSQVESGDGSTNTICGKQHLDKYLASKDGCFRCKNKGHKMKDFSNLRAKRMETNQDHCHDPKVPLEVRRNLDSWKGLIDPLGSCSSPLCIVYYIIHEK